MSGDGDFVINSLGRKVPTVVNGKGQEPYQGPYAPRPPATSAFPT